MARNEPMRPRYSPLFRESLDRVSRQVRKYKAQGTHAREVTPLQEGAPTAAFL